MDIFNRDRTTLNELMEKEDDFFKLFTDPLNDQICSDEGIPRKYRELMGLAISISVKCDECIAYHVQGCLRFDAGKREIIEAIKIGVMSGGSVAYPKARYAFQILRDLKVVE